jgi:gliding motility-associated-like protein
MFRWLALMFLLVFALFQGRAQVFTSCPENIGFESGTFHNWECYRGLLDVTGEKSSNTVITPKFNVSPTKPINGLHTLIKYNGQNDFYGNFPLKAPNGSSTIIRLGNDLSGRGVDRISYTLDVPLDVESYSITFNYAVVFQNPDHKFEEQPKFTARVIDVLTGSSTVCGSFEFVASGGLPGFLVSPKDRTVLYKPWAPILVDLSSYLGKKIRLEFTTSDCSRSGHFGYAYIDFNEDCSLPITGNMICKSNNSVTLKALSGFASYRWFDVAKNIDLGTSSSLEISPIPPVGTKIGIEMVPYQGLGCTQTLFTTIQDVAMSIRDPLAKCTYVDLTDPILKVGNSSDLVYTYWKDNQASIPLINPQAVSKSGTYYVKGSNTSGCYMILPIQVSIIELPKFEFDLTFKANYPATVDLTTRKAPFLYLSYSYWMDEATTIPLNNPDRVSRPGTYFIKLSDENGCSSVLTVVVEIYSSRLLVPTLFTPNGDQVNDFLTVFTTEQLKVSEFRIFNRWGNVVYLSRDINNYWNGFKENMEVPSGVYYWVLMGTLNSKPYYNSGNVTLIR